MKGTQLGRPKEKKKVKWFNRSLVEGSEDYDKYMNGDL